MLIAGGLAGSGQSAINLATAEIYNPQTEIFSPTGDLTVGRAAAGAALLPNGRVLVVAGIQFGLGTGPSPADSAELYDPASGSFRPAGNLTVPRPAATAVVLSATGKVLVLGDFLDGQASAEVYDPVTGSFSATGAPLTLISSSAVAELANGLVLVCGGSVAIGPVITDSAQVYDPVTATFSAIAGMNIARQQHTATLLRDGRVLVVGGYSSNGLSAVESTELYDPEADFGLALEEPIVYANPASRAIVTIDINRTGGFIGNVTVTPPDAFGVGVKVKPAEPLSSTESSVRFKLKIKASAKVGTHQLTFFGRDDNNRTRAVAVTLMIKQ